jgi:hypothetical protein
MLLGTYDKDVAMNGAAGPMLLADPKTPLPRLFDFEALA